MGLLAEVIQDMTALGGAPVTVISVLLSLIFGWYDLTIMLLIGVATAYAIVVLIKLFYVRDRPVKRKSKTFIQRMDAGSFPSMHSMRATVIFGFWAMYIWNFYFSLLCAVAVFLVLWTRVKLKKHWWSDVIGGLVFGVIIVVIIAIIFGQIH